MRVLNGTCPPGYFSRRRDATARNGQGPDRPVSARGKRRLRAPAAFSAPAYTAARSAGCNGDLRRRWHRGYRPSLREPHNRAAAVAYRSLLFPCRKMPVPQADPQVRSPPATATSKGGMHWPSTTDAPGCDIQRCGNREHAVIDPVGPIPIFRMGSLRSSCSAASNVAADVRRHRLPVLKGGFLRQHRQRP